MKKITIVQTRMSSTRLPGKVMKKILGKPLIELMWERLSASKKCGTLIMAISENPNDDILEEFCSKKNIECFRGNENDLLDRHYQCAIKYNADIIAKIPSDCPLIDPSVIDKVFDFFEENEFDFVSNLHPATYPDGNDVEIFTLEALKKAHKNAKKQLEREHTTPYFWENPNIFTIGNVKWETGLDYSMSHRFTIDYQEDFDFIKRVYTELYKENPLFSLDDILDLLNKKSDVYTINSKYAGVNWYRNHLNELNTINQSNTKNL